MNQIDDFPLVSIFTPFLNLEGFLRESIESVLSQYYYNWELLLVDDGSSDNSTAIAKKYAGKYPGKIKYLEHENHENRGISASLNLAFRHSNGKLISFLDGDDVYLPDKLQSQVPLMLKHPEVGLLYASTEYWYSWNLNDENGKSDWVWNEFGVQPDKQYEPPTMLTAFLQNGATVPCMGSLLLRREAIESVGGWNESFKFIYTDQAFHSKIFLKWPIYISSGCWDRYRQHPDSTCAVVEKTGRAHAARERYLSWLETYLIEKKVDRNSPLWKALQNALSPFRPTILNRVEKFSKKTLRRSKQIIKKMLLLLDPNSKIFN